MIRVPALILALFSGGASYATECTALRNAGVAIIGRELGVRSEGVLTQEDDTCRLDGLEFGRGDPFVYHLGTLQWRTEGVAELMAGESGLVEIAVNLTGGRFLLDSDNPWPDYIFNQTQRRSQIDGELLAQWDMSAGRLDLNRAEVEFPGGSSISITYGLSGLGQNALSGRLSGLDGLVVGDFNAVLKNQGYFDGTILAFLAGWLAEEPNPEVAVGAQLERLKSQISELPSPVFPRETREALTAMLDDGPTPHGELSISIDGPGLPLDRFVGLGLSRGLVDLPALRQAFRDHVVRVQFTPTPPQ